MFYILDVDRVFPEKVALDLKGKSYPLVDTTDGVVEYYTADQLVHINSIIQISNLYDVNAMPYYIAANLDRLNFLKDGCITRNSDVGTMWKGNDTKFGFKGGVISGQYIRRYDLRIKSSGEITSFNIAYRSTDINVRRMSVTEEVAVFDRGICKYVCACSGDLCFNAFFKLGNFFIFNFTWFLRDAGVKDIVPCYIRLVFDLNMNLKCILDTKYMQENGRVYRNDIPASKDFEAKMQIALNKVRG